MTVSFYTVCVLAALVCFIVAAFSKITFGKANVSYPYLGVSLLVLALLLRGTL